MTVYSQNAAQCIPRCVLNNCMQTFGQMCFQIVLTYIFSGTCGICRAGNFLPVCFGIATYLKRNALICVFFKRISCVAEKPVRCECSHECWSLFRIKSFDRGDIHSSAQETIQQSLLWQLIFMAAIISLIMDYKNMSVPKWPSVYLQSVCYLSDKLFSCHGSFVIYNTNLAF